MAKYSKDWNHYYWHVLILCSLVFSQPLFDSVSRQPEFLLAHSLRGFNLLLWIIAVGFLAGLLIIGLIYILAQFLSPIRKQVKAVALYILISLFIFMHINDSIESKLILTVLISVVLAALFVLMYAKSFYVRTVFSWLAFLFVLAPLVFSLNPAVRQILFPESVIDHLPVDQSIEKNPVVFLLFDELSLLSLLDNEGNINDKRYPNFAELSAHSTWYKYATTAAEATLNAVPPLLTGMNGTVDETRLPLAANYPENLFTLLSGSHQVNAFETFTLMCPEYLCNSAQPDWRTITEDTLVVFAHILIPDQYRFRLPQIDNKWVGYLGDKDDSPNIHTDRDLHPHHRYKVRMKNYGLFLSELKNIEAASLNYLHILMPHSPWMYLQDGRVYAHAEHKAFTGTIPNGTQGLNHDKQLFDEQHLVDHAYQRHLLQTAYVDKLLGDILSVLKARGMFEEALIVVLADHGVSFRPGESLRSATDANYQEILSIPLFIKYPGQDHPETDVQAVRLSDVLPTILDALNSKIDFQKFDGRSLLRPGQIDRETIDLQRDGGVRAEYDFNQFKSRFDQAVKMKRPEFANGPLTALYAINGESLMDKAVSQFPAGPPVNYSLRLDNPHLYDDINLEASSLPTLIRANSVFPGGASVKKKVAVSVNGIMRGVSFLQKIDHSAFDFQVLVAPESFQAGQNSIRFFQLDEDQGNPLVSPIPFEDENKVELTHEIFQLDSFKFNSFQLTVNSTGGHGEITLKADPDNHHIRLGGWSAKSQTGEIAAEVFFFSDYRLIGSVKPQLSSDRAKKVTGFEHAEFAGFSLTLPINHQLGQDLKEFSAIAVFDPEARPIAAELRYSNRAEQYFTTRTVRETLGQGTSDENIKLGQVYDFSDDTQALLFSGSGWAKLGGGGARWNVTREAVLKFSVEKTASPLEVIVESSPFFVKGKHELQAIEVRFRSGSSQLIKLQRGESKGQFVINVNSGDIGEDGTVLIGLKFLNAASPQSLGVNNDVRQLALRIKTIKVVEAEL